MDTEHDAFRAAIAANPADHAPRLIYADRLQELGDDAGAARQRELVPLADRIAAYVAHCDAIAAAHYAQNYPSLTPHRHRADFISEKWCRVVRLEKRGDAWESTSVHVFVCLQDGFTKQLGTVRAGDIHKAESFKRPARHARGSVLSEDFGRCTTAFGATYLR